MPYQQVSIDSRTLQPGATYYALRGERHDGHDFVAAALAAGAARAIVAESERPRCLRAASLPASSDRIVGVPDPLRGLQDAANAVRRRWGGPVVAVTGSAGKTTTKEMIAAVLATRFKVLKSGGNLNNHIGVPLTLLALEPGHQIAVVEMGMNHAGEIARLAEIAEPNVGVFTNVGAAHVGLLGSIEAVAEAKRELATGVRSIAGAPATLVLNRDDPRVARFGEGFSGRVVFYPGAGDRREANAAAAVATGAVFGIDAAAARAALAGLAPLAGRGEIFTAAGMTFINDSYNANPEAMAYMLDVLARTPATRRVAVLGEMRELGAHSAALHRDLGTRLAAPGGPDAVVAVGGDARIMLEAARAAGFGGATFFCQDATAAGNILINFLRPGDAVLFKASRGIRLEAALERVRQSAAAGH